MKVIAFVCALAGAGCILPISTGAPLPATTVGKGHVGFAVSGEAPTLDLIADNDNSSGSSSAISYGAAPAASLNLTLSYGLGENTDIELGGEGALYYFILPLPTGGSIGLRQHFDAGETFDLGIAARVGTVGGTSKVTDSSGNTVDSGAGATYAAIQGVLQTKRGPIRPLLALNLIPARITRDPSDEPAFDFKGFASSVTLGAMIVGQHAVVGPYVVATNFYSDRFDNSGWFVSFGIMFALRNDRNRPAPPPPPLYAPPPPSMGPPAPMGPAPMGPSPPSPPPGEPPNPTTTPM